MELSVYTIVTLIQCSSQTHNEYQTIEHTRSFGWWSGAGMSVTKDQSNRMLVLYRKTYHLCRKTIMIFKWYLLLPAPVSPGQWGRDESHYLFSCAHVQTLLWHDNLEVTATTRRHENSSDENTIVYNICISYVQAILLKLKKHLKVICPYSWHFKKAPKLFRNADW